MFNTPTQIQLNVDDRNRPLGVGADRGGDRPGLLERHRQKVLMEQKSAVARTRRS